MSLSALATWRRITIQFESLFVNKDDLIHFLVY